MILRFITNQARNDTRKASEIIPETRLPRFTYYDLAPTRNLIKRFVSLFEPALILVMGVIVGLIVISMLIGIFSINDIPI